MHALHHRRSVRLRCSSLKPRVQLQRLPHCACSLSLLLSEGCQPMSNLLPSINSCMLVHRNAAIHRNWALVCNSVFASRVPSWRSQASRAVDFGQLRMQNIDSSPRQWFPPLTSCGVPRPSSGGHEMKKRCQEEEFSLHGVQLRRNERCRITRLKYQNKEMPTLVLWRTALVDFKIPRP